MRWWRVWTRRRRETPGVAAARERLEKAHGDDRKVDEVLRRDGRLRRENGLAQDIEAALRLRRS